MQQKPFRLDPHGPASAYQTFQIRTPKGPTFERPATCEDVNCEAMRLGWITRVPATDEMLDAVRKTGRSWLSADVIDGQWVFTFAPGTECFASGRGADRLIPGDTRMHRKFVRPDLPQLFVVRDGDWRGNPRGTPPRIHQRPEDWVEHCQETTAKVVERIERG